MGYLTAKIRDYSDEYTTFRVRVADMTALNVWSLQQDHGNDLETALTGAILGTLVSVGFTQDAVSNEDERPLAPRAQRETGLRISYIDNVTNKRYGITIGTADLDALAQPGTDLVPITHAEVAPIVTWMESNIQTDAGNSITVESAKTVGRNN